MVDYSSKGHQQVVTALTELLADMAIVYFKTHGFHWNVEGENFYSLHLMFEKFYKELWKSMDEVAERIRALGEKTPPSYAKLLQNASIKESETAPKSSRMVEILREDYLALAEKAHSVGSLADEHEDLVTTDMMTEKETFLEKAAWMLQSSTTD